MNNNYTIITEPIAKSTAPAAAIAALHLIEHNPDALLLILSSDHHIKNNTAFIKMIEIALPYALNGKIVTFGMNPTHAETGYGYILQGEVLEEEKHIYNIKQFVEKPNKEKANQYLTSGLYSWNSGMFMVKAKTYLEELKKYQPDIYEACKQTVKSSSLNSNELILDVETFKNCPLDSIDYAIMEKTHEGCMVKAEIGWNDVGSWDNLWALTEKDNDGNVNIGDITALDCEDSYFLASKNNVIAAVGLKDIIAVQNGNATLIVPKDRVQEVKEIANMIASSAHEESLLNIKMYRPWGCYQVYANEPHFKIKKIVIKPNSKISLQSHNHRAEHWIVIKGIATITKGDEVFELHPNESTFISPKQIHRLENRQNEDLYIIEVQTGTSFDESDIIRYEDIYGRVKQN
jgi:mannose-1-phosphate guanylyltransferase/mannose-6-phosphate isomerase